MLPCSSMRAILAAKCLRSTFWFSSERLREGGFSHFCSGAPPDVFPANENKNSEIPGWMELLRRYIRHLEEAAVNSPLGPAIPSDLPKNKYPPGLSAKANSERILLCTIGSMYIKRLRQLMKSSFENGASVSRFWAEKIIDSRSRLLT